MRSERAGAARRADVVIAGAGLSGLITAALLSRRGLRVVMVDAADRVGGRAGSVPHRPFPDRDEVYWLDGGLRDGVDVGDLQVGWRWGRIAAREAGVEVPIREVEPRLRVHRIAARPGGGEPRVCEGSWGAAGFARLAGEGFGCADADLPAFLALLADLGRADAPTRRSRLGVRLDDWLTQKGVERGVRDAVLSMVKVIYCEHPERASVGRLMSFLAPQPELPALLTGFADHAEAGGMQGLVEPFAQAIGARGGDILLRWQPLEVGFDPSTGRACRLLALDPELGLHEVEARQVVLAAPLWQALAWLPSERVPARLAAMAVALEDEQADAVGWHAGLRRLPRLRSTGQSEGHVGWNRVLVGPEGRFLGGFQLPSLASRRAAPEGRHLLHAFVARWLGREERPSWASARERLDRLLAHLRDFYLDLDECTEWSRVQAVPRPACLAWFWSPIERHGVRVPGAPGVYLASSTFESDAGPVDICAHAALVCARAIAEDAALPGGCAGVQP